MLFDVNRTAGDANAAVFSTANHHTSSVFGMRRTCSHAEWRRRLPRPAAVRRQHCDLSLHDLGGVDNITEEACAEACLHAPMCNAYTWGPGGAPPGADRCYLKSSTLGGTDCISNRSVQTSGWFCKDAPSDTVLAAGALQYLTRIPPGTAFRHLLSPLAGRGITAAADKWGRALRSAARLVRAPPPAEDPVVGTATSTPFLPALPGILRFTSLRASYKVRTS